jgi:AraC-like DNA-binding protein
MVQYGWARFVPAAADRRTRPLAPTQATLDAIHGWIGIHLGTLDRLDGGERLETYLATPGALATLQPRIADGLLSSAKVRAPEQTFSLFTWLNNGGLVMDWLIAGIEEPRGERIATGGVSTVMLAQRLKMSRTHLSRKLRAAEGLGSIGWLGQRGHSVMWVSPAFYREYAMAQAVKLAIIDDAFCLLCAPQFEGRALRRAEHTAGHAYSAVGANI